MKRWLRRVHEPVSAARLDQWIASEYGPEWPLTGSSAEGARGLFADCDARRSLKQLVRRLMHLYYDI